MTRKTRAAEDHVEPLADIRIVALEQYAAGPWGSLQLADLGAEVIKVEEPRSGGDVGRYVPPYQEGEDSLFFETFNRNKRSLDLDLATTAGREVFEDLVRVSDVVYSNLRGDVPERLALRYRDLAHVNPRIVCCALSAYGGNGPRARDPGYDYMVQGLTGWMTLTGEPDSPPAKTGLSLVDLSAGVVAAFAMLAGVHAARRDGVGMDCDLSLYDTAVSFLSYLGTWHLTRGYEPVRTRHSAHPSLVPFQNFQTHDGWIVVGCPKEKFWALLAQVVGRPDLAADPRFANFAARRENSAELLAILEDAFAMRSSAEWLGRLQEAGVPCAPVNAVAEALDDQQVLARDLIVETEHPRFGTVRQVATPARAGMGPVRHRRAPRRNEDQRDLLEGLLEYGRDRVAALTSAGAFGAVTGARPGTSRA